MRRALGHLLAACEHFAALVLAVDVAVVFTSVIWRYFLHDPLLWSEEIARAQSPDRAPGRGARPT